MVFGCGQLDVKWITRTLQTAESINLEQIAIRLFISLKVPTAESVYQEWQDLDRLLLQFWASHSIRPKVRHNREKEARGLRELAPKLLPELTSRGVVDLIDIDGSV